jgi:3-hydroxyacyl-CoA dehydrogenase
MRLGYIGLGSMGGAMARNLAVAGHDLTVYDLDPGRIEDLVGSGARRAASGGGVGRRGRRAVHVVARAAPGRGGDARSNRRATAGRDLRRHDDQRP